MITPKDIEKLAEVSEQVGKRGERVRVLEILKNLDKEFGDSRISQALNKAVIEICKEEGEG